MANYYTVCGKPISYYLQHTECDDCAESMGCAAILKESEKDEEVADGQD
jgi:hypothetical protein